MLRGRLRDRQGQGRRARTDARPTTRPASRRCATRSGRTARVRVDANGAWDGRRGGRPRSGCSTGPPAGWSTSSSRAPRSRTSPPYAAGSTCRSRRTSRSAGPRTPTGCATCEAADIAVLKVQPLGGVRACLRIAEDIGLPVVVSIGAGDLASGSRPASRWPPRCPTLPYACGLATVQLLTDDVVDDAAAAGRRRAAGGRPSRRPEAARPARGGARPGGALGGPAGRGAVGRGWLRDRPPSWPATVVDRLVDAGVDATSCWPRVAQRAARVRVVRRRGGGPDHAAHADRRAHGRLPRARPGQGRRRRAAVVCTSGTAAANLHPAVLEAAHAGVPLVVVTADRPARCAAPAPTRPPTRSACSAMRPPRSTWPIGRDALGRRGRRTGPVHLNVPARRAAGAGGPAGPRARGTSASRGSRREFPDPRTADRRGRRRPTLPAGPRTVVIAGDDAGPPARSPRRERPAGRCSPSRAAGRAPGDTRSAPTGCCSAATLGRPDRAGRRLRAPDAVAAGEPAPRPRTSRWSRCAPTRALAEPAVPGPRHARRGHRREPGRRPAGSRSGATADRAVSPRPRRLSWPTSPASRRTTSPRRSARASRRRPALRRRLATRSATST